MYFFDFSTSLWKVKLIVFTGYIGFFCLFDRLLGVPIDWYYWMYWIFSTLRHVGGRSKWLISLNIWFIRLFDFSTSPLKVKMINFTKCILFFGLFYLLLGGQTDWFYLIFWILFDFSTFRPLAGSSKWLILTEYIEFFRFFNFSIFWWEVKIINLTAYIDLFRLFDLLLGGQTYRFYWIYWFFLLLDLLMEGQNNWFYWIYCIFSTFRLFDRLVGVQINWFWRIFFFYFSTFRAVCWEVKLIDFK